MESKTELKLQADNRATSITNYQPLFTPCYHKGELHIAIRSYDRNGLGYYVLVNPHTLITHIVLKGDIQHRKQITNPKEVGYYTKEQIDTTPYGLALKHVLQSSHPIANDGIVHSLCKHESNELFLTIDLCPSTKLFEKDFFERLVSIGKLTQKPVPIAICMTEFWRTTHWQEFDWLLQQQNNTLQITWVNHSATHVYFHDYASPERLDQNFLLDSRTNLAFELFEIEKALIEHGQVPSIFFRAPGLITNEKLMKELDKYGLITLGADAWLAKEEKPQSGSIVLVHGNANEPLGIKKIMSMIEQNIYRFLPLQQAFPTPENIKDYLAQTHVNVETKEETDDEAEKELIQTTDKCISSGSSFWQKPHPSLPGTRVTESLKDSKQRLTLFRALKADKYEITQHRDTNEGVYLKVQLPTIR